MRGGSHLNSDLHWRQEQLAACLGGDPGAALELASKLDPKFPEDWRAVAAQLATQLPGKCPGSSIVGIGGGQGAGKSTLARALVAALGLVGVRAAAVSLDDFYLTRAQRRSLGEQVHPLLATRGVPGTHDLALLRKTIANIGDKRVTLPRFDKAADDRLAPDQWPVLAGPLELLIFEGWCIGATPQPKALLRTPVNELEAQEDPDGDYRTYVNQALASDYVPLWQSLFAWLYLALPDMAAVRDWRWQQEQQLHPAQRMSAAALERFIAHYQRLTQWQFEQAPQLASWTLGLDADHRLML